MLKERRAVPRTSAGLKAFFRVVSGDTERQTKEVPAIVANLSETGFCLNTNFTVVEDLHVLTSSWGLSGNTLQIRIPFPDKAEIRMSGTACWYNVATPEDSYGYVIGVSVTKMSKRDYEALREFLGNGRPKSRSIRGTGWLDRLFRRS